jgi:uncharacterized protein YecE (DUF72 family)
MKHALIHVGTSGWYYNHWVDVLYPPGLAKAKRFGVYAQEFNSVEINATYYRLPSQSMISGWYRKAPEDFVYAAKAYKNITHTHKLKNAEVALEKFLSAIGPLDEKLGTILFQLPPSLKRDDARLQDFLVLLPPSPPSCFEFRHESWECDETYETLAQAGAGHVVVSRQGYPFVEKHTGRVAYYRLHGPGEVCASSYSDAWLEKLAGNMVDLSHRGTTVFAFFNNDIGGHAVRNARSLKGHVAQRQES